MTWRVGEEKMQGNRNDGLTSSQKSVVSAPRARFKVNLVISGETLTGFHHE